MDLTQKKLSKAEWENIEVPVSDNEKKILKVIMDGYLNNNIRFNDNQSMIQMLRILSITENMSQTEIESKVKTMHDYFYIEYFSKEIQKIIDQLKINKMSDKKK